MHPRLPRAVHVARVTSNARSYRALRRQMRLGAAGAAGPLVAIELRPLAGRSVSIRPGTTDAEVVWDTFVGGYHLPPPGGASELRRIWDLGANIGLTIAHLAVRHPRAEILGVELEPGNAALARANIAPWQERCELLEAAVWTHDGEIGFGGATGQEHGFHVTDEGALRFAPAVALNTLRARGVAAPDYVKMDIEGAERDVLRGDADWAADVAAIKVEVHHPYTVQECVEDLTQLGFRASISRRHWACVVGTRR